MSAAEAIQENYEFSQGFDVDLACEECSAPAVLRYVNGEPIDATETVCSCGGLRVEC